MTERFGELDDIFAHHEAERNAQKQREAEQKKKQHDRIIAFKLAAHEVIRPAMRQFGEYLNSKGSQFLIDPSDEQPASYSPEASIKFTFAPPNQELGRFGSGFPLLSFNASIYSETISLHRSTISPGRGGQSSVIGTWKLAEITDAFVTEKLKDLVREVLKR